MLKKLKKRIIITLSLIVCTIPISIYSYNEQNNTIKVGFYDYKPYYFINKKGEIDGYYHKLLNLLATEANIKYEYIKCDFSNAMDKLENEDIDILLGVNYTSERAQNFVFTNNYIDTEVYGIYTNDNVSYGKLEQLEGKRFAFLENEANSKWILQLIEDRGISINPISVSSDNELISLLKNKEVDAITANIENKDTRVYKKVYEYSKGPVYLIGSKSHKEVVEKFNDILNKFSELNEDPVMVLKSKYFDTYSDTDSNNYIIFVLLSSVLLVILGIILFNEIKPIIKKDKIKKIIRNRIKNNEYILYYQPIVNPKNNAIVGIESLLRLKNKDGTILSPYIFLDEIEENDMLFEISIWILEETLKNYKTIMNFDNLKTNKFYISLNVSLKEIENEQFINIAKEIALKYNMQKNTICLEIVEKVGINDLSKITKSITILKEYGYMIAIDDFGVEYSNLSVLQKLDFDIIKLDKYFMEDVFESSIRQELIKFLSNVCILTNKSLIAEGVENVSQRNIIKSIDNNKFYIQGYFYSKPVDILQLKTLHFTENP